MSHTRVVLVAIITVISLTMAAPVAAKLGAPTVSIVGNGGVCKLSGTERNGFLQQTFRFKVTGAPVGHQVMILVFYPQGLTDPVHRKRFNAFGFYWYHKNFGIYTVPSSGTVVSTPWDCRYDPRQNPDPKGKYTVKVIDLTTLPEQSFRVIA